MKQEVYIKLLTEVLMSDYQLWIDVHMMSRLVNKPVEGAYSDVVFA